MEISAINFFTLVIIKVRHHDACKERGIGNIIAPGLCFCYSPCLQLSSLYLSTYRRRAGDLLVISVQLRISLAREPAMARPLCGACAFANGTFVGPLRVVLFYWARSGSSNHTPPPSLR